MIKDGLEKDIEKIKTQLGQIEKTDDELYQWDEQLRELRHWVIYIHSSIENVLIGIIGKYISPKLDIPEEQEELSKKWMTEQIIFQNRLVLTLDEMEFYSKTQVLRKLNIMQGKEERKLLEDIQAVNRIRIMFSHPSAFIPELQKYKDRSKYHKDLKFLLDTFDKLNEFVKKFHNDEQ